MGDMNNPAWLSSPTPLWPEWRYMDLCLPGMAVKRRVESGILHIMYIFPCSKVTYRNLQDGTPFHRNAPNTALLPASTKGNGAANGIPQVNHGKNALHSVSVSCLQERCLQRLQKQFNQIRPPFFGSGVSQCDACYHCEMVDSMLIH